MQTPHVRGQKRALETTQVPERADGAFERVGSTGRRRTLVGVRRASYNARMTRIIGHRGSHRAGGAVENTLAAFQAAIDDGADMVELDVWQSADGELVIYHDDALPGHDRPVSEMTWAALRRVELPGGGRVPRLADALALMRGHLAVNVEIKHGAALDRTLRVIRDLRMDDDVLLSSFDLPAMYAAAERAPGVARALIMGTESLNLGVRLREAFPFWHLRRADAVAWHPGAPLVGPAIVEALHGLDIRVNVWTVNEPALARRLRGWGVDGLFTDHPGALRAALAG
jgi:glycerophosphoryl diester phosphodiesterase